MMRNCSVRTGSNRILRIFFFISDIRAGISARIGLILIHGYRIGAITVYIYIYMFLTELFTPALLLRAIS